MTRAPARPAPPADAARDVVRTGIRISLLAALVLTPFLFASFYPWVFGPFHALACLAGMLTAWRQVRLRGSAAPLLDLPGAHALLVFVGIVLAQLLPLPPLLLRLVSPGTFEFHSQQMLLPPLKTWKPITVSPPDTAFGLLYLVAMILLYLAVFHAFASERWKRLLLRAIVYAGMGMTFVGLAQAAAGTQKFYGLFGSDGQWAMFGPFLGRSHFGGYMVMAIGIALGLTAEALIDLQRDWSRRRVGWLALGDPAGTALVRRGAEGMVLVVGLVAAASRGAFVGFGVALLLFAAFTRRRLLLGGVVVVAVAGISWIGLDAIVEGFKVRGLEGSRLALWRDTLRMFPDFPLLGVGWNAFGTAYLKYQTFWRYYFVEAAHNEYLELLLTTGVVGLAVGLWAFVRIVRPALARALRSPLDAGVLSGLLGLACHNLVDFNWQILPNAATFVALLALAVRPLDRRVGDP
jgi:O-antigen ligase